MKTILFSGQLMSGKDVSADYICDSLNENLSFENKWKRTCFAKNVKDIYKKAFGVDDDFIEKWKRNEQNPPNMNINVRKALQFIGDGFRSIKENVWIESTDLNKTIISDGRYINEAYEIKRLGGISILLCRPDYINNDPNPSESQLCPIVDYFLNNYVDRRINKEDLRKAPKGAEYYDFFIVNDRGLDNLYTKLDRLVIPCIREEIWKEVF